MARKYWRHLALLLLLLGSWRPQAVAQAPITRLPIEKAEIDAALRTDWFGVYLQGQKIGFAKETVSRVGDPAMGGYRATLDIRMKLTAMGAKTELEIVQTFEFEDRPPYALRQAVSSESNGQSTKETRFAKTDGGFDVTITAAGMKSSKRIATVDYTLSDLLTPGRWLQRGAKVGDKIVSRSFDFDDLQLDQEVRKLAATKTSTADGVSVAFHEVEVSFPKQELSGFERYDQKGHLLSMKLGGVMELRREAEDQARNAEYSADLFVLGTVKIDKPLGDPDEVASLVLEVVGDGGAVLKSGPRQVVSRNPSGTYTCKTGKLHGQPVKATAREIEENRAETIPYPIQHPAVQALLKEAIGDAQTPQEKVERLVRFVTAHITPSYTAQPLTLLDLLKVRKGDCTEYALLFTTLARAAGIPAREVNGLVYMGDAAQAFGPHAWNEVVLDGHWVPVDASCRETEINGTHISFGSNVGGGVNLMSTFGKLSFKLVEVKRSK
jgi:hypothetical protein